MLPNLLDLDDISVRLDGDDRRPTDVRGHVRAFADLTTDSVTTTTRMVRNAAGDEVEETVINFRGHAAVFNSMTWIGSRSWGFWEKINRNAFDECLARPDDVRFLQNHNPDLLLARNTAGTMELTAVDRGLQVNARIAAHTTGLETAVSLQRGDLTQMSFAFDMGDYVRTEDADGNSVYEHTNFRKLYDVAVVTYPAYDDTDAGLRSMGRLMARDRVPGDGAPNPLAGNITNPDDVAARTAGLRRRHLAARTLLAASQRKG